MRPDHPAVNNDATPETGTPWQRGQALPHATDDQDAAHVTERPITTPVGGSGLSVRALFVGMKLAVDTSKTACLTDVHALLTDGLAPSAQRDLRVIDGRTGAVITLHQVRRLLSAIQVKLDPSPATAASLDPEELAERAASLQEVLDLMLAATMPATSDHTGGYAVDGTGTWS